MKFPLSHILPAVGLALSVILLPGCFTGIESTARIKDKTDGASTATLAPEQTILAAAAPEHPSQWLPGKAFIVTPGRFDLAFSPATVASHLQPGDTLRLISIKPVPRLSGDTVTDISFRSPYGTLSHRIDIHTSALLAGASLPIPFTIEAHTIDNARTVLQGRDAWTLKPDAQGEKYKKVKIVNVSRATPEQPLLVITAQGDSIPASLRTFPSQFSLSNPRSRYPQISDSHWAMIVKGQVAVGMTRDECRLALGAPKSIDREAAYNAMLERWTYENGVYLNFADGILTSFRR